MSFLRSSFALAALCVATVPASAEPTKLTQQNQCSTTGLCTSFTDTTALPVTVRSFTLNLPAPGRVQWTFTGSAQCFNDSADSTFASGVMDINTEITTSPAATPSVANPSGNRYAFRLPPTSSSGANYSQGVNFSSTRTVSYTSGGLKTVYFRIGKNRIDAGSACNVLTGAFSTVYAPN